MRDDVANEAANEAANDASVADPASTATVASLSALYLGNILYALERCAISLAAEGKAEDAGFYRGIGRVLAEARGRERGVYSSP